MGKPAMNASNEAMLLVSDPFALCSPFWLQLVNRKQTIDSINSFFVIVLMV
jgi:hypothetical protein